MARELIHAQLELIAEQILFPLCRMFHHLVELMRNVFLDLRPTIFWNKKRSLIVQMYPIESTEFHNFLVIYKNDEDHFCTSIYPFTCRAIKRHDC